MIRLPKFLSFLAGGRKPGQFKVKPAEAVCGIFRVQKNGSLFMMKRKGDQKFLPGYDAFPWTKIIRDDKESSASKTGYPPALVRIMRESFGVELETLKMNGKILSIHPLGKHETPDFDINRFRTAYYLIECDSEFSLPGITSDSPALYAGWRPAVELRDDYKSGNLLLSPVMNRLLHAIADNRLTPESGLPEISFSAGTEVPVFEPLGGVLQFMPLSCTFPPINRTNCLVVGDEDSGKMIMDPSPVSMDEYNKLVATIVSKKLDPAGIFITHHHRDHHQGAPMLAKKFSVPISMSRFTREQIEKILGRSHFNGVEIKIVKEGDVLTRWHGKPVKVYEIPGHDKGHLGAAPESMEWFLAGDLIQGAGTVVIGGEEGDMAAYFKSMQRVVDLNPKVVFPSHGLAQGTAFLVKQTLEHRLIREKQILSLHRKGKTPEQMVTAIYPSINRYLRRLALENVNAHLRKLEDEKVI